MKVTLRANKITYLYNTTKIIKNLTFDIKSGSSLLISGKNGIGKTTLLRIIAGILQLTSGSIELNGEDIQEDYYDYKKCIAYLGHKNAFNDDLTVEQNLRFWGKLRDNYELILPAVYYFNLGEVMYVKYSELSAGWQKRVALVRLMIFDAIIWLLDEPFVNLDQYMQELLYGLLNTRIQQGGIVIIASHKKIETENMQKLDLDKI